jgi:hypothetical protein
MKWTMAARAGSPNCVIGGRGSWLLKKPMRDASAQVLVLMHFANSGDRALQPFGCNSPMCIV